MYVTYTFAEAELVIFLTIDFLPKRLAASLYFRTSFL